MAHHIIHKQKVIINISGIDNAFNYQDAVSKLFANGLTSATEEALNEIDKSNTIVRIDKLNIDLGEIHAQHFADEFKEKFLDQLKQSVQSIQNNTQTDVTVVKVSSSLKDAFFYFMRSGKLPWYVEVNEMKIFESKIFHQWNDNDWINAVDWLKKDAAAYNYFVERLVWQFSDAFLIRLFATDKQINKESCELVFNDLQYVYNKLNLADKRQHLIDLFTKVFNASGFSADAVIASTLLSIFQQQETDAASLINDFSLSDIKSRAVSKILTIIQSFYKKNNSLKNVSFTDAGIDDIEMKKTLSLEPKKITTIKAGEEQALICDNCGVVLLHPFLQPYFEDLKLTENKKFVSEEAQKRVVLLLYYISTGLSEVAEFNLVLQKILCGYISEESLPASIELTEQEIGESKKLLQSVINYWPPLKNTSIEALQNTFLQRKGKLIETETGWQLTVEQKTVDILLAKLTWGFSTIKLPWMNALLTVDWY